MKKKLILVYDENAYFYPSMKERLSSISVIKSIYKKLKFTKKFFSLFYVLSWNKSIFYGDWKYLCKDCDRIIIFDAAWEKEITTYIKKRNPSCKLCVYITNKISPTKEQNLLKDENVDSYYTFDEQDSIKYSIGYNPLFYDINLKYDKELESGAFFMGRSKGRDKQLSEIAKLLEEHGVKSNIVSIDSESEHISYYDYLKKVQSYKILIDVPVDGQVGMTYRVLEAVYFNKKLITTNKSIAKLEFYDPHNIYIIGYNKNVDLQYFLTCDVSPINKEILEYYDVECWLERIRF